MYVYRQISVRYELKTRTIYVINIVRNFLSYGLTDMMKRWVPISAIGESLLVDSFD